MPAAATLSLRSESPEEPAASDRSLPVITVAAGIIWREERFLAAQRPAGKPRAGYWEFPGGKLEPGETPLEALHRELREELDIGCRVVLPWKQFAHDYPDQRVVLHFMHVTAFSGVPIGKDGQELRWVTPEEARSLPFLPADRAIISALAPPGGLADNSVRVHIPI